VPDLVTRMKRRLEQKPFRSVARQLWTATYVLMGLRYEEEMISHILRGVLGMKESVTYQAIVEEGRIEGAREELRKVLFRRGEKRFGAPAPAGVKAALEKLDDLETLEQLAISVVTAQSWEDLVPTPVKRPRRRRNGS